MGTNEVTESLRHNENFFDLPLERQTLNSTVCIHVVQLFVFCVHTFCVKSSNHGNECCSRERPKLALMQLITFGSWNGTLNL